MLIIIKFILTKHIYFLNNIYILHFYRFGLQFLSKLIKYFVKKMGQYFLKI